jgi:NAD(P)H-nitrite reductase large subunit
MTVDYLIIGAGVAGTTAAESIRARDPQGSIALVGDEPHRLYSRVMLPMVVDGRIPTEKAYLKGEDWYVSTKVEFLRGRRVSKLDGTAHRATLDDGTAIEFTKALIATGGRPKRLDVPGHDLSGVHRLQTIEDAAGIRDSVAGPAVVIGGGFIALEFVNGFMHYNVPVTVCLRGKKFWEHRLDATGAALLEKHLTGKGVRIIPEAAPLAFLGNEKVEGVKLSNGETIACTSVGIGIGLEPNFHFIENVLKTKRGIASDEYLETSAAGIFAAGDISEFNDLIAGHAHVLGNWFNAREQGRAAGANMAGAHEPYHQVSSYSISALGMNVAFVGDVGSEGHEVIARGDGITSYASLMLRDGKLRGGVFLNRVADRAPVLELIKTGKDVSNFKKELADENFDLKKLLA